MGHELDLDALAQELSDFAVPEKKAGLSPRDARVLAGFEDIQRFVDQHGHPPRHGDGLDIFERLYALRLDRLRQQADCHALLAPMDHQGLLAVCPVRQPSVDYVLDDQHLLAELDVVLDDTDIQTLRHVRSQVQKREAEEIAQRTPCVDFHRFQSLFEQAQHGLRTGFWQARPFVQDARIESGDFFILGGLTAYVAEVGKTIKAPNGDKDARLRLVFSNRTESNLLLRSLQRALYKDDASRRLVAPGAMPLFGDSLDADDIKSGTIYVLRSQSTDPYIAAHRDLIHKIGVTGGRVEDRISQAAYDATYLMADVQVVATYQLAGIHRVKLENLFHRLFAPAQISVTIPDRLGRPIKPREWFLVPLHIIDEAVRHIQDGSIIALAYDPDNARLVPAGLG